MSMFNKAFIRTSDPTKPLRYIRPSGYRVRDGRTVEWGPVHKSPERVSVVILNSGATLIVAILDSREDNEGTYPGYENEHGSGLASLRYYNVPHGPQL